MKFKIYLSTFFVLLLSSSKVFAFPVPPIGNTIDHHIAYICNSSITEIENQSDCSYYSLSRAAQIAQAFSAPAHNPECDMNPNNPTCTSHPIKTGAVTMLIYDMKAGGVKKIKVDVTATGNPSTPQSFSPYWVSTSTIDQGNAEILLDLDNQYLDLVDELTFSSIQGRFLNAKGQSMKTMANNAGYTPENQKYDDVANCDSSLAYPYGSKADSTLPRCDVFLNDFIRNVTESQDGTIGRFFAKLFNAEFSLSAGLTTFNFKQDKKAVVVLNFPDGSVLTLKVTDNGIGNPPGIETDLSASFTAEGVRLDMALAEFGDSMDDNHEMSYAESEAWSHKNNCGWKHITEVWQTIKVTVIERAPDSGKPTKVEFTLMGQTENTTQEYTCG